MASSDHLTPSLVDPWILRPASFLDPWLADAFSRDAEALTRSLQMSLSSPSPSADSNSNTANTSSSHASLAFTPDVASSFLIPTPGLNTPGFGSGSFEIKDAPQAGVETARCEEVPVPKLRQRKVGVSSGKVAKKRKSRATKRSQTTFIMADPVSFRQMVQQVTGSRLGHNPAIYIGQISRPEPHRPVSRLPVTSNNSSISSLAAAECLPTLDTSAFLLDVHHTQDQQQEAETAGQGSVDRSVATPQPAALTDDFEPFGRFPTLESWDSMQTGVTTLTTTASFGEV